MTIVTVFHNGIALLLSKDVADRLGHQSGDNLTEAQTWEAIEANATAGISACLAEIKLRSNPQ